MTITLSLSQILYHVLHDFIGRIKAKGTGVAYIQLNHALTLFLKPVSMIQNGAANVVANAL